MEKQQSFTYVQLLADTAGLRKQILEKLSLSPSGDLQDRRIAFLAPNGYDYVVTQWAVWAAGVSVFHFVRGRQFGIMRALIADTFRQVQLTQ